jgi:hypothetical protein
MSELEIFPRDFGPSGPDLELPVYDPIRGKSLRQDQETKELELPAVFDWSDQFPRPVYDDETV